LIVIVILYGLLIVLAIVLIPIRMRNKRKNAMEIKELSAALEKNKNELVNSIQKLGKIKVGNLEGFKENKNRDILLTEFNAGFDFAKICRSLVKEDWTKSNDSWDKLLYYNLCNNKPYIQVNKIMKIINRVDKDIFEKDRDLEIYRYDSSLSLI